MKKSTQVHIYLSPSTINLILPKVEDLGLSLSGYIKHLVIQDAETERKVVKKEEQALQKLDQKLRKQKSQ